MSRAALAVFNVVVFLGLALLIAILATACFSRGSERIHRTATWFTLLSSGVLLNIVQVLVIGQQVGLAPNRPICIAQGILIYPTTSFFALMCTSHIIQLYLLTRTGSLSLPPTDILWLNIVPISLSFLIFILATIIGLLDRSQVQRDPSGFRCHIANPKAPDITIAVSITGGVIVLVLEGLVVAKLVHNRALYYGMLSRNTLYIRTCIFNAILFVAMLFGLWQPKNMTPSDKYVVSNITLAILPLALGLMFGTQTDILSAWIFWKRNKSSYPDLIMTPATFV
ncbi:hypothetical protein CPB84DRAFT_1783743 [Gymnopilus junonius]|uniref:Uncharacterized protein n=1 Tax=Gymnopilus junonius TaxID=109634 RepID=A0A9P5NM40_GYMJU|nr:hypothetical protein CPB84DRAFT_1783743 [Gymnopilus junonius]